MFVSSGCTSRSPESQIPDPWPPWGGGGVGGARTVLTAALTMPAENATVVAQVEDTEGLAANQIAHISPVGWFQVVSVNSGTSVTLRNADFPGNSAPGASAPA